MKLKGSIKRGISLIALVVTIIVSIILVSVILLTLDKNDPRKGATEDVFKSDFRALQDELAMKKVEKKKEDLSADIDVTVSYDDQKNLKLWIESIDKSILNGIVEICNGELVFVDNGLTEQERKWAEDVGALVDSCDEYTKKRGGFYFTGSVSENIIKNYTWTNQNVSISVDTSYAEDIVDEYSSYLYSIDSGEYKNYLSPFVVSVPINTSKVIRIKGVAATSSGEKMDFIEDYIVKIDKINPEAPDISINVAGNDSQIILTGARDDDSGIEKIEYSVDKGTTWKRYESPITISNDIDVIYSRAWDIAGNVTSSANYKKFEIQKTSFSSIDVVSPESSIYKAGTEINIEAKFAGGTPATAPALNLTFGRGNVKTAIAKNKNNQKITYSYTIAEGDNGVMELANDTYDSKKEQRLSGYRIVADTIKPEITYIGSTINDVSKDLIVTEIADQVKLRFRSSDINIEDIKLTSDQVKLYINGVEDSSLSKSLSIFSAQGQNIDFEIILSNFKDQSGNYSLVIPAGVVSDKASNYNEKFDTSAKTTIPVEVKIDTKKPSVTSVEMESNNEIDGKLYAKNGNSITLSVKFDENLSVPPRVKIAGRDANLISSSPNKAEYSAVISIPTSEINLEEKWLGYSISGYKDSSGIEGDNVTKEDSISEPIEKNDTLLYDRTSPVVVPKLIYKDKNGNEVQGPICYNLEINDPVVTEDGSGLNKVEYKLDDGNWQSSKPEIPGETGNYSLYIRAIDNAGNISEIASASMTIDKTPPTISADFVRKSSLETLQSISTDGNSEKVVSLKGKTNDEWINKDDGGIINKINVTDGETGFDRLIFGHNKVNDFGSSISTNLVTTLSTYQSSYEVEVSEEGKRYYVFTAYDKVGNEAVLKVYANIDMTPPTYFYGATYYKADDSSFEGYRDSNGITWCHHANISVTGSDAGSGVDTNNLKYKWNSTGSDWVKYNSNPITFKTPGVNISDRRLYIQIADKAGNISASNTGTEFSFGEDVKAPDMDIEILKISDDSTLVKKTNPTSISASQIKSDDDSWINKADEGIHNVVSLSDDASGYDGTIYSFNASGTYDTVDTKNMTTRNITHDSVLEKDIKGDGKRYYTFTAYDKVGNSRQVKVYVNIDKVAPTYTYNSISLYHKNGSNIKSGWCYEAKVSVTVGDTGSGITSRKYKWNTSDGEWTEYTGDTKAFTTPKVTNENRRLYIYVKDKAGNVAKSDSENSSTYATMSVDVTPPKAGGISYSASAAKATGTFSLNNVTDNHSGAVTDSYKYYFASDVSTQNKNGIRALTPKKEDFATKTSTKSSITYNMEKGKLYAFKAQIYDKVGNSAIIQDSTDSSSVHPVYRYGPCNHFVGSTQGVKPSKALKNYSIENYYFDKYYWDCYGCMVNPPNGEHYATYEKKCVLMACQYCHIPVVYLTEIGGEPIEGELSFRLWCEGYLDILK